MDFLILALIFIFSVLVIISNVLHKILSEVKECRYMINSFMIQYFTDAEYEDYYEPEDSESVINESVLEREKLFDNRIEQMKAEMEIVIGQNEIEQLKEHLRGQIDMFGGTHGEILAEGIYNIPHNQVVENDELEIAD